MITEIKTLSIGYTSYTARYFPVCVLHPGHLPLMGRIEENTICAPNPFNIHLRDTESLLMVPNCLVTILLLFTVMVLLFLHGTVGADGYLQGSLGLAVSQ